MELKLTEVAERIRTLREIMGFTTQEMADTIGCTVAEYEAAENGETDFSFTFLFKCADKFGVDMIEILTGENPHLLFYSIVRKGEGLPIKRRSGFDYYHLAPYLKGKFCEPFLVTAPYKEEEQEKPTRGRSSILSSRARSRHSLKTTRKSSMRATASSMIPPTATA